MYIIHCRFEHLCYFMCKLLMTWGGLIWNMQGRKIYIIFFNSLLAKHWFITVYLMGAFQTLVLV